MPRHAEDFDHYPRMRNTVLRQIRELRAYLSQLDQVVKAMPADSESATYLDLDNLEQLRGDLEEVIDGPADDPYDTTGFCDWDALGWEFSRLGLPAEVKA